MKYLGKIVAALVICLGLMASVAQEAEAGKRGRVIAGTILGAIALGIAANEISKAEEDEYYDEGRCYKGERVCKKKRVCWEDQYGDERCRIKRKCFRPTYCD